MQGETYEEFVEKFKPKKTTDDCYTPPYIYDAVQRWAINEYRLDGRPILRPFYPGGDYEHFEYQKNGVVIDNPPFSILSKIITFYIEKKYRLFSICSGINTIFYNRCAKSECNNYKQQYHLRKWCKCKNGVYNEHGRI